MSIPCKALKCNWTHDNASECSFFCWQARPCGCKMTSEHGKASVLPAYAVYAGRSVASSEFRPYFFCWKEWISLWRFRLKLFASALCSSTPFFCRFRMFLCRIAHEDLCWIRFWWAAPTRVIRTRRGRLFLFAFSTPYGVNRKPRRISFFTDYALFEFTLGSGTQVSFADSEHRMRHNNKK